MAKSSPLIWYGQRSNLTLRRSAGGGLQALAERGLMKLIDLDTRKTPYEGQEFWHLDSLRLALGYPQHV